MILQPDIARFPWGETIRSELHVGQVLIDGIEVLLVEEATTRGERHRHLASRSATRALRSLVKHGDRWEIPANIWEKPIGKGEKNVGKSRFLEGFFFRWENHRFVVDFTAQKWMRVEAIHHTA